MSFAIVRVDPEAVETGLGVEIDMPAVAVVGLDDGRPVGAGGLAWGGGRCWIWFKMTAPSRRYAVAICRATKKMLQRAVQLGEREVYTPRDESEPMSEKLLVLLGFEFFAMEADASGIEHEVWKWSTNNG